VFHAINRHRIIYDTEPPPAIGNTELIPIREHEIAVQYMEVHIRIVIKWNKIDLFIYLFSYFRRSYIQDMENVMFIILRITKHTFKRK
jgi:hypothetical protein